MNERIPAFRADGAVSKMEAAINGSERFQPIRDFLVANTEPIRVLPPLAGPLNETAKQLVDLIDHAVPEESMDGAMYSLGIGAVLSYAQKTLGYVVSQEVDRDIINPFTGMPITARIYTPPASLTLNANEQKD